jgi:hypothetical protein
MKVKKSMKYAGGGPVPKKKPAAKDSVESEMFPGKMISKEKSNYENKNFDKMFKSAPKKSAPVKKKAKSGGSFPDLNKDGKVTKADVLVGRGVIKAKKGAALKKQAATAIAMKKAGKTPKKKMQYGGAAASMVPKKAMGGMKMMKGGGKCKYGC